MTGTSSEQSPQPIDRSVSERAAEVVVRCFAEAIDADAAILAERNQDHKAPPLIAAWDRDEPAVRNAIAGGGLISHSFDADGAIIEPPQSVTAMNRTGSGPVSAVAAPVRFGADAFGAICAGFATPPELDHRHLCWTADSFARLAAMCIGDGQGIAEVLGGNGVDSLTGCLTYDGLIEVLEAELRRSQRQDHRLSCCFIDLDGFKAVNDGNGHLEGNRVLAAVGPALRAAARSYDAIGRFGGDEFVVVLPETGAESGRRVAERLRAAAWSAIGTETDTSVDVSIGVAEWDGSGSSKDLLEAADGALGDAKLGGGARVVMLEPSERGEDGLLALTREVMRERTGDPHRRGTPRDGTG